MKSVCTICSICIMIVGCCQAFSLGATTKPASLTSLYSNACNAEGHVEANRRELFFSTGACLAGILFADPADAADDTSDPKALVAELEAALERMKPIPSLLEQMQWDAVRSILKTSPVVQLWGMGDSKNTLLLLAKMTDNFDLIELKDELSLILQMCDEVTYNNVFVYSQPGNGKVKIKEPTDLAVKAMAQLSEAIDIAKSV